MERRGQVIIDVDPEDLVIDGKRPAYETDKVGVFARKTFSYGMKSALNFIGWCIKETLKIIIDGFKMAAAGNRELSDELRRNRPRYVRQERVKSKALERQDYSDRGMLFYIPTRDEEEILRRISEKRYGG